MNHTEDDEISFASGEWTYRLDGRADLETAKSACRTLENCIPNVRGPVSRRKGTRFMAYARTGSPPISPISGYSVAVTARFKGSGATATLCGFDEFPGFVSTPPLKYRQIGFGGTQHRQYYYGSNQNCSDPTAGTRDVYASGQCYYISGTCTLDGQTYVRIVDTSVTGGSDTTSPTNCGYTGVTYLSATLAEALSPSGCFFPSDTKTDPSWSAEQSGTLNLQLSEVDTPLDAVNRDTSPWSAYGVPDAYPVYMTSRTTGFTFQYNHAQFDLDLTGLLTGHYYKYQVQFERVPLGSLSAVPTILSVENTFLATSSEYHITAQDFPNDPGYQTTYKQTIITPLS